jgi:hypothetical protein
MRIVAVEASTRDGARGLGYCPVAIDLSGLPCRTPFDGALEGCIIRFPLDEASTDTVLGSNSEGLYMSSSIEALKKSRQWSLRYYAIKTRIFIPWDRIRISDAKFPLRRYLRFNVPSNKATFFVPRETGRRLAKNAGRVSMLGTQ